MRSLCCSVRVFSICVLLWCGKLGEAGAGIDEYEYFDAFDEVRTKVDILKIDNCVESDDASLFLSDDSLTHRPDMSDAILNGVSQNRTAMFQLYNMAISRAFFWSFILQSRLIRPTMEETYDPGMMYYLLSSVADIASDPRIHASSTYYSPDKFYTSSYKGFFNQTLPRFAPRAYKSDYLNGVLDSHALFVEDLGVFDLGESSKDYTSQLYRTNEWYKLWLPDTESNFITKTAYQVEIRYENNTNETFTFFGPPGMDENPGPVKWTRPYYDCERLNNWLVGAVSPVADLYPRHTNIKDIEKPMYTAAVVMEMDYELIDINQCPTGSGNQLPNHFASTAQCNETTELCVPLPGWGFNRGGYQCRCAPGYRPLNSHSDNQHINGSESVNKFECVKIEQPLPLPFYSTRAHPSVRAKYLAMHPEYVKPKRGTAALHAEKLNIQEFLKYIRGVKPSTCSSYHRSDLHLNNHFAYGASQQLENQAKLAVRLSNFISAYLQVNDSEEEFADHDHLAERALTEEQMLGETLSILADQKILSAGTFWDRNKFINRTLFAPFAYRTHLHTRKYKLDDLARSRNIGSDELYTHETWFETLKQRYSNNFDDLEKFYLKIKIRKDLIGNELKRFQRYPVYYRAANIKDGYWTSPYYDCDGPLKQWVLTYAVPFFGWDSKKVKLEFKGVVAVTVSLESLDINQCPDKSSVPNAFKGTDKCDKETSYCVHVPGYGYDDSGYRCECLPGYEYPYDEPKSYYDGVQMETEFEKIISNDLTLFDKLKCRPVNNSKNIHFNTTSPVSIYTSNSSSNNELPTVTSPTLAVTNLPVK